MGCRCILFVGNRASKSATEYRRRPCIRFSCRTACRVKSRACAKTRRAKTPKARTSSTPGTAKITQITPPSFSLPPVSQNIEPRSRAGASTPLNGIVIYSDDWNGDYKYGMYSWPTDGSSTEPTIVALDKNMKGQAGRSRRQPLLYDLL